MMTRSAKSVALVAAAALSVSACVSLIPETEPSVTYRLSSPAPADQVGGEWRVVRVDPPLAPRGLGGEEIAIGRSDGTLAYMANAQWISPAPRMMQTFIIETMNAQEPGIVATRPEDGVRADYELRLDLRAFEAHYDQGEEAAPLVRVRLGARLVAEDGRSLIASRVFSSEARASANRGQSIIAAFERASEDVASGLTAWTAEHAPATHSE
jgi:cholesterol transport system auxiliary component